MAGTYGTLTLNANGSYTYTLNNAAAIVQPLRAGHGHRHLQLPGGRRPAATASATLVVTITGTNDAPVAADDATAVTEDGPSPPPATCWPTTPTWTTATPRP